MLRVRRAPGSCLAGKREDRDAGRVTNALQKAYLIGDATPLARGVVAVGGEAAAVHYFDEGGEPEPVCDARAVRNCVQML